jgi:hypothetical protein
MTPGPTSIYLALDNNSFTGFQVQGIGSEILVQGGKVYSQQNGGFNEGLITSIPWAMPSGVKDQVEMAIPRSLQHPASGDYVFSGEDIRVVVRSANTSWSAKELVPDYPDYSGIPYSLADYCPAYPAVDGAVSDWTSCFAPAIEDASEDSPTATVDIVDMYVADSPTHFLLSLSFVVPSDFFSSSKNNIFIDTDNDINTGYAAGSKGTEILIQRGKVYSQKNGGFNDGLISATAVSDADMGVVSQVEISIPKNLLHPDSSDVFNGGVIRLYIQSEDSSWSVVERVPDSGGFPYTPSY